MLGETQPASKPGSIRLDYSNDLGRNICHGSDSPESAEHELKMWSPEGVNDWKKTRGFVGLRGLDDDITVSSDEAI